MVKMTKLHMVVLCVIYAFLKCISQCFFLHNFPLKLELNLLCWFFFKAHAMYYLNFLSIFFFCQSNSDISFEYLEWHLSTNANTFFKIIPVVCLVRAEDYKKRNLVGCSKGCLGDFFFLIFFLPFNFSILKLHI